LSEGNEAVAICIVTHDSAADLPGCFESIAALDHRPLEVVVVDCASRDGSLETARAHAPAGGSPARRSDWPRTAASPGG